MATPKTPMSPAELGLPYADWQSGQWDVVSRLVLSEAPYVLLEAPTGIGKSGIVTAVANLLDTRSLVLTGQKQLQDQYAESLDYTDVRGRSNFPCLIEKVAADEAPCTVGEDCPHKTYTRHKWRPPLVHEGCDCSDDADDKPCPYYDQRYSGLDAQRAVLNYAYWLTMANYTGEFTHRPVMVFDEAQTLEDEVRRFATIRFSRRTIAQLDLTIPWFDADDIAAWQAWATECRKYLAADYRAISRGSCGPATSNAERLRRRTLLAFVRASDTFLLLPAHGWVGVPVIMRGVRTGTVEFKPVWVAPLMHQLVWRHVGERAILMSATILDRQLFCEQVGLTDEDATGQVEFIQLDSSFDRRRRPLYYRPVDKVSTRNPETVKAAVAELDKIIDQYPEQAGIVHTVSYALAGSVIRDSRHTRRMIGHERNDKAAQLEYFKRSGNGIWVSPSSGTGLDLPYDECRWQVIMKLPFPNKEDKQIKQIMREDPTTGKPLPSANNWYMWVTLCNLIQMYGRGMRAPDDQCDSYLLDENWRWFRAATGKWIPRWVRQAIINPPPTPVYETQDDLLRALGVKF